MDFHKVSSFCSVSAAIRGFPRPSYVIVPSKRSDSDDFLPHTRRVNRGRGGTSSGNNLSQLARNSTRHIPLIRSQSTSRRYSTSSVAPPVLQPPSQTREWVVPSLLRTNRGNPLVVHQNCRFRFHRPTADGSHGAWRCNEKTDTGGCPARIICHGNTPLDNQSPNHNHAYPTTLSYFSGVVYDDP